MIIREATPKDAKRLLAFIEKELAAWGQKCTLTLVKLNDHFKEGWRLAFVEEAGVITTVLAGLPLPTSDGPAFDIRLWLVAHSHADRIKALDALALWGANTLSSEGVVLLLNRRTPVWKGPFYGRDYLGMDLRVSGKNPVTKEAVTYSQAASPETVIKHIFDRRPEWVLSL